MSRSTENRFAIESSFADIDGEIAADRADMAAAHDEWLAWMQEMAEADFWANYGIEYDPNPYGEWDDDDDDEVRIPF